MFWNLSDLNCHLDQGTRMGADQDELPQSVLYDGLKVPFTYAWQPYQ